MPAASADSTRGNATATQRPVPHPGSSANLQHFAQHQRQRQADQQYEAPPGSGQADSRVRQAPCRRGSSAAAWRRCANAAAATAAAVRRTARWRAGRDLTPHLRHPDHHLIGQPQQQRPATAPASCGAPRRAPSIFAISGANRPIKPITPTALTNMALKIMASPGAEARHRQPQPGCAPHHRPAPAASAGAATVPPAGRPPANAAE